MKRSLFARLLASYILLVLVTLLLLGAGLGILFPHYELYSRTQELTRRGVQVAELVREDDLLWRAQRDGRPVGMILDTLDQMMDARIWVTDHSGLIRLTSSPHRQWRGALLDQEDLALLLQGQRIVRRTRLPFGGPGITVAVPIVDEETAQVHGAVLLHSPLRGFWRSLANARMLTLYAGLAAVALATGMGYLFSRTLSRPIKDMTQAVHAMQQGDFGRRVEVSTWDELGTLAQGFNSLAARLGHTLDSLHREHGKIDAILRNMGEGVIALDEHGRIILVNPAFSRMVGLEASQLLNRSLDQLEALQPLHAPLTSPRGKKEPAQTVIPWGESTYLLTVTSLPAQDRGTGTAAGAAPAAGDAAVGRIGVLRDITERERLERMRREFLANVGHDLRTPLTTLRGFLQAVSEGVVNDMVSARRSAQVMLKETLRLIRLVNTLVDLSRLQSGSFALKREPVALAPLLEDLLVPFLARAQERGITLEADIPADLPPLWADGNRVEQIISNLLDNALKFTRPGDRVTVSAQALLPTQEAELHQSEGPDAAGTEPGTRPMVRIRVTDTGPGIAPEDLPYIWERFYKGDKARARQTNTGSGLGLVIVKDLTELHGGRVWAESRNGITCFEVTLPACSSPEPASIDG